MVVHQWFYVYCRGVDVHKELNQVCWKGQVKVVENPHELHPCISDERKGLGR